MAQFRSWLLSVGLVAEDADAICALLALRFPAPTSAPTS
jgi:hypothetical protein